MLNLYFLSNTRETVLFRIYEALGTRISPWRTQPSRRRRGTLDPHPLFFLIRPIDYIRRIVYLCVEGLLNIAAHRVYVL